MLSPLDSLAVDTARTWDDAKVLIEEWRQLRGRSKPIERRGLQLPIEHKAPASRAAGRDFLSL
jgi:hypothetical protein